MGPRKIPGCGVLWHGVRVQHGPPSPTWGAKGLAGMGQACSMGPPSPTWGPLARGLLACLRDYAAQERGEQWDLQHAERERRHQAGKQDPCL